MTKIFISGGCKNGKSRYGQTLAMQMGTPLYFLATMVPADEEDRRRIENHRRERIGCGFETVEVERDILRSVRSCDVTGTFLLDSVTALLANEMFDRQGNMAAEAPEKIAGELAELAAAVGNIVFVSDDIFSDAELYDSTTEAYRKGLALIGRRLAGICDTVLELSAGNAIIVYKDSVPSATTGRGSFFAP